MEPIAAATKTQAHLFQEVHWYLSGTNFNPWTRQPLLSTFEFAHHILGVSRYFSDKSLRCCLVLEDPKSVYLIEKISLLFSPILPFSVTFHSRTNSTQTGKKKGEKWTWSLTEFWGRKRRLLYYSTHIIKQFNCTQRRTINVFMGCHVKRFFASVPKLAYNLGSLHLPMGISVFFDCTIYMWQETTPNFFIINWTPYLSTIYLGFCDVTTIGAFWKFMHSLQRQKMASSLAARLFTHLHPFMVVETQFCLLQFA